MVVNIIKSNGGNMFGLKRKLGRPPKQYGERATYKQVAVSPRAHARLSAMADRNNSTIIDTVNKLVGV